MPTREDLYTQYLQEKKPTTAPSRSQLYDQFLNEKATKPSNDGRTGEAALEGFGQGATLGYLNTPQALLDKGIQEAGSAMGGEPAEDYDTIKKYWDTRSAKLKANHPIATAVGNVGGAMAMLPAAEMGLAGAGFALAPEAGILAKVGKGAAEGAVYGGAQNTEGEGFDGEQRLKNAKIGLALGAAAEPVAQGIGGMFGKIGSNAEKSSVVKQVGANAGQIKKMIQKDELPRIGEFMENEKLMRPGKSLDDVVEHTSNILNEDGPKIGQLYKDAQAKADEAAISGAATSTTRINGDSLADEIVDGVLAQSKNHTDKKSVEKTIKDAVGPLRDMGEDANLSDLHDFRKSLDENINWGAKSNEKDAIQRAYLTARNKVNDAVKNQLENLDTLTGGNQLEDLKNLNSRFSTASTVNTMATQGQGREMGKTLMGHGIIGGGAGALAGYETYKETHDPIKALGIGLGTAAGVTAARKFGAPLGFYGGQALQSAGQGIKSVGGLPLTGAMMSPWTQMKKKEN